MEWIIVLIIALFLLSKNGGSGSLSIQAGTSPVINNATGGSLSGALGNQQQPPNYYASGNPGYNTQQPPTLSPVSSGPVKATYNYPVPIGVIQNPIIVGRPESSAPVWSKVTRPILSNLS